LLHGAFFLYDEIQLHHFKVFMKKLVALLFATLSGAASASGSYDGIYVDFSNPNNYVAVHTSGNTIIATSYGVIPASGIVFSSPLGSVIPTQINTWSLLIGGISGASATVAGRMLYEACNVTMSVAFSGTGAVVTLTGVSNTIIGNTSGVNCAGLWNAWPNGKLYLNKIF